MAVAGSIRRGADAAEDAALAAELLASEKDREEQAIVVDAIRDQLAPIAETLEVAPEPSVMTPSVRPAPRHRDHGHAARGARPAVARRVCCTRRPPSAASRARSRSRWSRSTRASTGAGTRDRSAGSGADDDGELCVALRCGIVDHTTATLFAGCGIVADSDPAAEWEESRMKLRAVVSALGIPADER